MHDPGGKVRLRLQPGVDGNAGFSECGRYRHWLSREWGFDGLFADNTRGEAYALWIGCNPSTAEADVDDPTIRKEIHYTQAMGLSKYVKCNIMDYRTTYPADLTTKTDEPSSPTNLPTIIKMAADAIVIVAAWGSLPRPLKLYADDVEASIGMHTLMCMGTTKDGSPRHPLYLRNDAQPTVWRKPCTT
jgi:hypothetical protein